MAKRTRSQTRKIAETESMTKLMQKQRKTKACVTSLKGNAIYSFVCHKGNVNINHYIITIIGEKKRQNEVNKIW